MALDILENDPLLTDREAATELGVCLRTLRRWDDLGDAPALIKVGRQRYRRRSAVRQWLISREARA
jgi:predicted site-specific integrase-resolvase